MPERLLLDQCDRLADAPHEGLLQRIVPMHAFPTRQKCEASFHEDVDDVDFLVDTHITYQCQVCRVPLPLRV